MREPVVNPDATDIGKRVSIRVVGPNGDTRDLVGILASSVTVRRRDGTEVEFDPAAISHWRRVADRSAKAGAGAPLSLRVHEIESAAAFTWPAEFSVMRGDWLLRSSGGITRRANSALPLGVPPYGCRVGSVEDAVSAAVEFAQAHGIRPVIQVPLPTHVLLDEYLARAGWSLVSENEVLVHDARDLGASDPAVAHRRWTLRHEDHPSPDWSSVEGGDAAASIMSRYPADYLSIWAEGIPVAAGRLAAFEGWGVVTRVFVSPAYRGRGAGIAIMRSLGQLAMSSGIERLALQVSVDNRAALGLYARLGFRRHHGYRHRERAVSSNTVTPGG